MGSEGILPFSVASVVEDVLQQHGTRLSDIDLASRKEEEAAIRRFEAAEWLRRTVGVVGAKDMPTQPSEEEFRLGLRNGIMLCNALNKIQTGIVPKVVETPVDSLSTSDGPALLAYQYFENVRNFLVSLEDMGLPTFEASDLGQDGKCTRVVNCVLALKSYGEWKKAGGHGSWKYGGNFRQTTGSGKHFVRKNSEPFMSYSSRNSSLNEKCMDLPSEEGTTTSLYVLIRTALSDKRPDEVPVFVESMLNKVMQEFERRIANHDETMKKTLNEPSDMDKKPSQLNASTPATTDMNQNIDDPTFDHTTLSIQNGERVEVHVEAIAKAYLSCKLLMSGGDLLDVQIKCEVENVMDSHTDSPPHERSKQCLLKKQVLYDKQQSDIQNLKQTLHETKEEMKLLQMKYHEEFCNLGKHFNILAHAALEYHRVIEENRKLYNQVQDLKGSIRVYCRVKPFLSGQANRLGTVDHIEDGSITITVPSKYGKEGHKSFNFNKVFGPTSTQAEVFTDTQPLIRSVLDGYNVCIFAYGQTGSGKTHTMTGPREITDESQGVNYRALNDLFNLSAQRKESFSYSISVQMIEIYNEQVRDLLASDGLNKRLEIRNNSQKGLNVPDANLVPVASTFEVIELMDLGQKNRAVGATAMNDRSSRSHSCLTVHVQGKDLTTGTLLRGCLHLVDLAGSERVSKSEATGERLKEAQYINKSLSALGDVIAALAQKNSHVPYRNSKLTQLLQDSLGGQAKTLMFIHINPEFDAIGETISTLKFAERVATVELGAAKINKESVDIKELKEQIASLKAALARRDGNLESFNEITTPEKHRIKTNVRSATQLISQVGEMSGGHSNCRQPMEDVGNIGVWNNPTLRLKKPNCGLEEDIARENHFGSWEREGTNLPDLFYQTFTPDMKIYPAQDCEGKNNNIYKLPRSPSELTITDESDELEVGTSDSSEADMHYRFNLARAIPIPPTSESGGTRMTKKTAPRMTRSPDIRTPPSQIRGTSPSPKLHHGLNPLPIRGTRLPIPGSFDIKRLPSAKVANGK